MGRESKRERCVEWEGRAKQRDVLSGKGEFGLLNCPFWWNGGCD